MVPYPVTILAGTGSDRECLERRYENGIYMLNLQGIRSQELLDFRSELEALRNSLDTEQPTQAPRPTRLSMGSSAPLFDLTTFDGQVYTLSDYQGNIVVINFWASWSIDSMEEVPELEKLWQAYQEKDVLILGISQYDIESAAVHFLEENNITYPTGADIGANIATSFGSTNLPETYILDRDGNVAAIIIGPSSYDELSEKIESLLSE
jgi:peroxiredoxin